ncbi:dolichol-phosphate mannosyltransferase subunit 3-like isoform X1 [Amphibalanus amphitrite]|uniref:dolichol-phosphate mannosyltransferase subunit 3-like isoform X1 n=1 Tax=Amphibalanus amphitrite TaxID=1232801 RepID=UPI001C924EB8|nr:dolichol-phosphate mannosyltransferase subunit 3-like isoform X1 [Amphibalanus amphitrite]
MIHKNLFVYICSLTDATMTMLMRWLFLAAVILGPWMAVLTNRYQSPWVDQNRHTLLLYPFALIAAFGVYSVCVIAWRVYSFNDCQEAADELQKQIKEAKEDLAKKGFKFVKS